MNRRKSVECSEMSHIFDGIWWLVELPQGWAGRPDEECATLSRSPQLGALQVSSARKERTPVADEDLREFAEERVPAGVQLLQVTCGPFSGFSAEYSKGESFWKEWWLKSGHLMVYVTYNVRQGKEHLEIEDVERIVGSLRASPAAKAEE